MELPCKTEQKILIFRKVKDKYLVIFDHMEFPKDSPAPNLTVFTDNGKKIWKTEPPTSLPTDGWVDFISLDSLVVGNFADFKAEMDLETGHPQPPSGHRVWCLI